MPTNPAPLCCRCHRRERGFHVRSKRSGFTLVEIMIVVATIALLAAIAVPGFTRARKRAQASKVKNDLRLIDSAVALYAIENRKKTGDTVHVADWVDYIKEGTPLHQTGQDLFGRDYADQLVDSTPTVPQLTYDALTDVADSAFWSPYSRETVPNKKATKKTKTKK
jgi:prepilin-type N-terminal cleavage/methylation domain-containing protein